MDNSPIKYLTRSQVRRHHDRPTQILPLIAPDVLYNCRILAHLYLTFGYLND
ncbi:MAG TPA: hypothetical protein V6C64_14355 [Microcoleaceae cyanobacterium]